MTSGLVLAASLAVTTACGAQELQRLSLDDASTTSPLIETDPTVKIQGDASLKITVLWPTTVHLAEVSGPDIDDAKLVYSAQVKSAIHGTTYLEMWAHVDGGQYFSRGMNDTVAETSDWTTIRTPFLFQQGQKPDKLTLNLVINGTGTVWIDDIVLSREPLE
jgi:hypothetical protein